MAQQLNEACPLWGTTAQVWDYDYGGRSVISARAGGKYRVTRAAIGRLRALPEGDKAKLTIWMTDQRRLGVDQVEITSDVLDEVVKRRSLSYRERTERFFLMLHYMDFGISDHLRVAGPQDHKTSRDAELLDQWLGSANENETSAMLRMLEQDDLIQTDTSYRMTLTPKGRERLDAINQNGRHSAQAFVAMWFAPEMEDAYHTGFAPGIREAGFEPLRIDQKEHANKIDDEIIAEIRRSRFLVADFTCALIDLGDRWEAIARGGVYYEAGFAQGCGIPVIWCVRADCIGSVHFDTRQFAHIVWTDAADLRKRLRNRIRAIIGEGPKGTNVK